MSIVPFKPDRQHTAYLEARASRVRRTVGWIAAFATLGALLLLAWTSSTRLFAKTMQPLYNQQSKGRLRCEPQRFLPASAAALADTLWIDFFGDLDGDGLEDLALCLPTKAAARLAESNPDALAGGRAGTTAESPLRTAYVHGAAFLLPAGVEPTRLAPTGEFAASTRKALRKAPIVYESASAHVPQGILRQLPADTRAELEALPRGAVLRIRWESGTAPTDPLVAYILVEQSQGSGSRMIGEPIRGLDAFYGGYFAR